MKRLLVTGARGFLGRAVVEVAQCRDLDVYPVSLPRSPEIFEPAYFEELFERTRPDAVIHTAVVRRPKNKEDFAVNARLPRVIAGALSETRKDAPFIHISSINTVLASRHDPYSLSKREAEKGLEGMAARIFRPGLIWSWDEGGDAATLRNYLGRKMPVHPMVCPGQKYRPVLLGPLASALVDEAGRDCGPETVHILGDRDLTVWGLARYMATSMNVRLFPIPTEFLEGLLPEFVLKHVPLSVRSSDAATADYRLGRHEDRTLVLDFTIPQAFQTSSGVNLG